MCVCLTEDDVIIEEEQVDENDVFFLPRPENEKLVRSCHTRAHTQPLCSLGRVGQSSALRSKGSEPCSEFSAVTSVDSGQHDAPLCRPACKVCVYVCVYVCVCVCVHCSLTSVLS